VNLDEALELRSQKIKKPIIVLSFFDTDEKKILEAVKNNIISRCTVRRCLRCSTKQGTG